MFKPYVPESESLILINFVLNKILNAPLFFFDIRALQAFSQGVLKCPDLKMKYMKIIEHRCLCFIGLLSLAAEVPILFFYKRLLNKKQQQ